MTEQSKGRTPTGAELDRVFSTNNYGRGVLRKWRDEGRLAAIPGQVRRDERPVPVGDDAPLGHTG